MFARNECVFLHRTLLALGAPLLLASNIGQAWNTIFPFGSR